jgi:membrane-bound metal-dependent hydrolase YbcI (DUF457 family)
LFAVGHLSLGYICGFATSKAFKTNINIPLILLLSVIPDIDILIPQLQHRGPTHSIITAVIFFIPFFIIYRKKATPYFTALTQHFLIGDFIAGGNIQLFWPITTQHYGIEIGIKSPINITAEWILFISSAAIMLKTNQTATFFKPHHSNLLLFIPLPTVLLPTFLNYPLNVPAWLIPPHLAYTFIFSASVIIYLSKTIRTGK